MLKYKSKHVLIESGGYHLLLFSPDSVFQVLGSFPHHLWESLWPGGLVENPERELDSLAGYISHRKSVT